MKHTFKITFILLGIFVLSQLIGLLVTNAYIDPVKSSEQGKTVFREVSVAGVELERPPVDESSSFIFIMIAILVGTLLVFIIMKYNQQFLWRLWFFFAVTMCLTISFSAFIQSTYALILSFTLAVFKIFKPRILIHNLTEVFIYGGLAVIFVPILNLFSIFMLLLLISIYDMYAVWKSKHMVTLAKYQSKAKFFAGLLVPYSLPKDSKSKRTKNKKKARKKLINVKVAVLGGGDIGFPLLFTGVMLKYYGLGLSFVIVPFTSLALLLLFLYGKKDKFYPAMPFLSLGCVAGFIALQLVRILF